MYLFRKSFFDKSYRIYKNAIGRNLGYNLNAILEVI